MTLLTTLRSASGGGGGGGLATIAHNGTPTMGEGGSGALSADVAYPSGIVANEVLILAVTASAAGVNTSPPATGWVLANANQNTAGGTASSAIFYKVATGSETGNLTVFPYANTGTANETSGGRITLQMYRFSGVDTGTVIEGTGANGGSGGATTYNHPATTTATNGAVVLYAIALNSSSGTTRISTSETGVTKIGSGPTGGVGREGQTFMEPRATAGSTGTRLFSNGGTSLQWGGTSTVLKPGPSGGGGTNTAAFTGSGTLTAVGTNTGATPALVQRIVGMPNGTTVSVNVKVTDTTSVRLKVGTNSAVTTGVVWSNPVTPSVRGDAKLTVSGLSANTYYYYRVAMTNGSNAEVLDTNSTIGRLRTAPSGQANFAFNFSSCNVSTSSSEPIFATIANRADELFFHLGDFYYADGSGTGIDNFRTKFNEKITATNAATLFATIPTSYTPSDHDGMNNNGAAGNDPTAWANWKTVYNELFPAPDTYYSFMYGRVLFIQIDDRSYKSPTANTDNSSKTALGATQKQWLKDQITNTTAKAIVIAQPSPWISTTSAGGDSWDGFNTERTELANFFAASGKPIVMLGGDMHALAADDGTNAPGGITMFHAAPLYNAASHKGGPYTTGPYPGTTGSNVSQYGRCVVTDTGTQISFAYTGYSSDNTARISLTKNFAVTSDSNFTGSAYLTGSGTLTATSIPNNSSSAGFTGSGTLIATGNPIFSSLNNFSGLGTLSASGYRIENVSIRSMIETYVISADGSGNYLIPTEVHKNAMQAIWNKVKSGDLSGADTDASTYNYEVVLVNDTETSREYAVLREKTTRSRWWGIFVWSRASTPAARIVCQVHTGADTATEFQSADLFVRSNAKAFLGTGSHRNASATLDEDGDNVTDVANANSSVFQAIYEQTVTATDRTWEPHGMPAIEKMGSAHLVGSSSIVLDPAGTSLTVPLPDGSKFKERPLKVGDSAFVLLAVRDGAATYSAPTGWVEISKAVEGTALQTIVFRKEMTSADLSSGGFTFSWSTSHKGEALLVAYENCGAIDVISSIEASGTTVTSHTAGPLTVTTQNSQLLSFFTVTNGTAWGTATTTTSEIVEARTSATDSSSSIAYDMDNSLVATGSYSVTANNPTSSTNVCMHLLALQPGGTVYDTEIMLSHGAAPNGIPPAHVISTRNALTSSGFKTVANDGTWTYFAATNRQGLYARSLGAEFLHIEQILTLRNNETNRTNVNNALITEAIESNFTGSAGFNGSGTLTATGVAYETKLSTTFTGANNASWPAPWTISNGTGTIQSNRGQLLTSATAWTDASALANTTLANGRVEATARFPVVTGRSLRIDVRFNATTGNGYRIIMPGDYNGFQLLRVDAWTETEIAADWSVTWAANTDYRIAFEVNGSTIRAKRWVVGDSEPGTWQLSTTDSAYTTGDVRLVVVTSTATANAGLWDDVSIVSTMAAAPVASIPNPERGFFYYTQTHAPGEPATTYTALSSSALAAEKAAGRSLVFRYVILDQFLNTDTISNTFLNNLAADFNATRTAGMKMIIRFAYSNSGDMTAPYDADPPVARVLTHISQLATTLNAHADIIDALQAGFIGMWGEWYYTDNFGDVGTLTAQNWTDRKAVVNALLDNLDSRIFVLLRYVGTKRQLIDEGISVAKQNRLGHHNDAFLAPFDDYGTYTTFTTYSATQNRAWLETDTTNGRFPVGGESAVGNSPTSDISNALVELAKNHWTFLNPLYHPDVISSWGQAGYDQIAAKLGYALSINNISLVNNAGTVTVNFTVQNNGFAAPYRTHPIVVDFVSGGTTVSRTLSTDTKTWVPGTTNVSTTVAAPSTANTWDTYLRIIDPSASLQSNIAYNIQATGPSAYDSVNGRLPLNSSVTTTATSNFTGSANFTGSGTLTTSNIVVAQTGSVALTGSGTLTVQTSTAISVNVSLTGSGDLTSAPMTVGRTGSASTSGSGTLTAVGSSAISSIVNLTGSGTLSTTVGTVSRTGSANFTGSGTLTTTVGAVSRTGSASLTGSGTLTSTVSGLAVITVTNLSGSGTLGTQTGVTGTGSAALSGSGTLTTSVGTVNRTGSGTFTGSGQLTAAAVSITASRTVNLTGSGTLNSTAVIATSRTAALSGSGTLSSTVSPRISQATALNGSGTLTLSAFGVATTGTAQLSGSGTLSPVATGMSHSRAVNLSGTGVLTPSTSTSGAVSANLSGTGTLSADPGNVHRTASANFTGSGTLTSSSLIFASGTATFTGSGSLTTTSSLLVNAICALSGNGILTVSTNSTSTSSAVLSGSGSLSTVVATSISQVATFTGLGTLIAVASAITQSTSANFTGSGTLNTQTAGSGFASANFTGTGTLTTSTQTQILKSAEFAGSSSLSSTAVVALISSVSLNGSGTLSATGQQLIARTVPFSGSGTLSTSATARVLRTVNLTGTGTLTASNTALNTVRTITLTGTGSLSATAVAIHQSTSVNFSGSGTVGFQTGTAGSVLADFNSVGTLSAIGVSRITETVSFSGTSNLTIEQSPTIRVTSTFTGSSTLSSEIVPALDKITILTGSGTLTTSRNISIEVERNLTGTGILTVNTVVNPRIVPGTLETLTIKMNSRQYNGSIISNRFTGSITRKSYPKG